MMNFPFFEALTIPEAREHLHQFLNTEAVAIATMAPAVEQANVTMDFSLESLSPVLKWIFDNIQVMRVPVPLSEPAWIQDSHKEGLISFPEESKYLILRAAYYLGECFVRSGRGLRWDVGNPEYIQRNMPVVTGFESDMEMPPMMVCESLSTRIRGDGAPPSHIDLMIQSWTKLMP